MSNDETDEREVTPVPIKVMPDERVNERARMWQKLKEQLRIPIGNCWGQENADGAFGHIKWYARAARMHAEHLMKETGKPLGAVWFDAVMKVENDPFCQASANMPDTFVPLVLFRAWPEQAEALMKWWIEDRGLPEAVLPALKEWGEDKVDYVTFRDRYNELRRAG